MSETYKMNIAGLTRELPLVQVALDLKIASFVILGDAEIVEATAPLLIKKLPKVELLVTAEAKGIPLVCEMARLLHMPRYIVVRKSHKPYMHRPLESDVVSITTQKRQTLYLDHQDALLLSGKRVALIDDVISTGSSLKALETIVNKAGGEVVAKAAVLAEGDAAEREDIHFIEKLPLFPHHLEN
ncbi:phosphoribosyltransferase family protein [Aureibacillus halotolerans]|uniref:Adenine phosphoribosyltransferase n=1 Tax=Aureibacillus halotolerans TaxID=1508390 RepID=A0A4R6TZA5_9BACI|nr:phosphoribosyltransferase family protein [Aureibacillus halotolerans]TDQ37399.1 adenine phosphoribosyltransferase [Aureibacillus halotolerans]